MNIQNTIIFILGFLILITTMLILIVMFLGILRVALISVFEYDYVVAYRNWKAKKKDKEEKRYKEQVDRVQMGYYVRKED